MKVYISQKMRDKTEEQILKERKEAVEFCKKLFEEYELPDTEVEEIPSFFPDGKDMNPIEALAKSIALMKDANCVVFCPYCFDAGARGTIIEHNICRLYGITDVFMHEDDISYGEWYNKREMERLKKCLLEKNLNEDSKSNSKSSSETKE